MNGAASLVPFGTKDSVGKRKEWRSMLRHYNGTDNSVGKRKEWRSMLRHYNGTDNTVADCGRCEGGLWCGGGFFSGEQAGEVTLLEGADAVAELGGFFELEFFGGFAHLAFELFQ